MFSKPSSNTPQPASTPTGSTNPPAPQTGTPSGAPSVAATPAPEPARNATPRAQKAPSIIGSDMTLEGDISGGGEIHIDGTIKGDVRIEHVTVGDGGAVEGGIYAEAVEVRGKVSGSITAKQVRLYGACHVDGDITHEQLAMETGAFFQGRSLRLQRPAHSAPTASAAPPKPEPAAPPRDLGGSSSTHSTKPVSATPASPAS
jgi:cytoskeletal protein CcmA (bactofilin family)